MGNEFLFIVEVVCPGRKLWDASRAISEVGPQEAVNSQAEELPLEIVLHKVSY